jgi:inner membrane protein
MNGGAHRLVAGVSIGLFMANEEEKTGKQSFRPVVGGLAGAAFTCLPDVLEPATSPNHRQFFHSLLFAGVLVGGLVKLHKWEAESSSDKFLRGLGMIAISAYLIHLALDATTPKSLPLVGA